MSGVYLYNAHVYGLLSGQNTRRFSYSKRRERREAQPLQKMQGSKTEDFQDCGQTYRERYESIPHQRRVRRVRSHVQRSCVRRNGVAVRFAKTDSLRSSLAVGLERIRVNRRPGELQIVAEVVAQIFARASAWNGRRPYQWRPEGLPQREHAGSDTHRKREASNGETRKMDSTRAIIERRRFSWAVCFVWIGNKCLGHNSQMPKMLLQGAVLVIEVVRALGVPQTVGGGW